MKQLTSILICFALSGCIWPLAKPAREALVGISREEVLNNDAVRESALNWLQIWPMQSGFIKGALGPRVDEMPMQVIEAIDELDLLSEHLSTVDPNEIEDYDLGLSLGLRVRLLGAVVEEALKMYAPDVIDLIPLLF